MAELQPTYGNFKLQGVVQGLERDFSFNDDATKNGFPRHQLRFDVKTSEDNIVRVELTGMGFEKVRITPTDRNDKSTEDIKRGEETPEGWEVFMGVSTGLEQDEEGKNIILSQDQYDAAKYIHDNLKDGDMVFIGGRNEFSQYTNNAGEDVVNERLMINRIYHSNKSFEDEGYEEVSSYNQTIILNDIDLDKKSKKAYISAYVVAKDFGELKTIPVQYWIDGEKYLGLIKNLKKLPFGTQVRVEGKVHSRPIYQEVEEVDDSWGERMTEPRNVISGVDKSMEITFANPSTIEEAKYTEEDLFPEPSVEEEKDNPFQDNKVDDSGDWGKSQESNSDSSEDPESDPFFGM